MPYTGTQLTLFTLPPRPDYRDWEIDGGDDPDWGPRNDSGATPKNDSGATGPPLAPESTSEPSIDAPESNGYLETYRPGGSARSDRLYYRYCYRDGNRITHIHIPGGNVNNPIAQKRADRVREMIRAGKPPEEILGAIADF